VFSIIGFLVVRLVSFPVDVLIVNAFYVRGSTFNVALNQIDPTDEIDEKDEIDEIDETDETDPTTQ